MKLLKRLLLAFVTLCLIAGLGLGALLFWFLWETKEVGAGYSAKLMATGVFVLGRTPESVRDGELGFLPFFNYDIDHEGKTVTGWVFPSVKRTAVYREGLGVALALDGDIDKLHGIIEVDGDMRSFDQYALELYNNKFVTREEAISACSSEEGFLRQISGIKSSEGRKILK